MLGFDMVADEGGMYRGVHISGARICVKRGWTWYLNDLAGTLAMKLGVRNFPELLLISNGRLIGQSAVIFHTPESVETWADACLANAQETPYIQTIQQTLSALIEQSRNEQT